MCPDLDAGALCLQQQVLQVVQVMSTDEDGLATCGGDAHLTGFRVAIPAHAGAREEGGKSSGLIVVH